MTAADKLRELLATRPAMPNTEELVRWWRSGGKLVDELLEYVLLQSAAAEGNTRMLQSAAEHYAVALNELQRLRSELARLQIAAPVMLTVMALLADEADANGLREVALWFYNMDPEHLMTWTDAEHARSTRERAEATNA